MIAALLEKKKKYFDALEAEKEACESIKKYLDELKSDDYNAEVANFLTKLLQQMDSGQIDPSKSQRDLRTKCTEIIQKISNKSGASVPVSSSVSKPLSRSTSPNPTSSATGATSSSKPALKPSLLAMVSDAKQLFGMLDENENHVENICLILDRLGDMTVSKHKVEQLKGGVTLAKLNKHSNPKVMQAADRVIKRWKRNFQLEKMADRNKTANDSSSKGKNGTKTKSSATPAAKAIEKKAPVLDKSKKPGSSTSRSPSRDTNTNSPSQKRPIVSKDLPPPKKKQVVRQESEDDSAWMKRRLAEINEGSARAEAEERYSAFIGEKEDREAEEDEEKEKKRLLKIKSKSGK